MFLIIMLNVITVKGDFYVLHFSICVLVINPLPANMENTRMVSCE